MKNRDLSSPIEYEVIYKDKIVPVKEKPKYRQEPRYREPKKTYKGGFITMTIIAFLVFVLGVGAAGYLIIVKPDFLFPPAVPAEYSVLYRNYKGDDIETLQTTPHVKKGSTVLPEYQGPKPQREDDASFSYEFNGKWSMKGSLPVSDNIEMLAEYDSIPKNTAGFVVTWNGYDEKGNTKVLKQERIEGGEIAEWDGLEPTRPANSEYTYEFDRWDPTDGRVVKKDMVFTAKFKEIKIPDPVITYHVKWLQYNDDGKLEEYDSDEVKEGEKARSIAGPFRKADKAYTYEFDKWLPDDKQKITADTTFVPQYNKTEIKPDTKIYTIEWKRYKADGNFETFKSANVEEGKTAEKVEGPTKASDGAFTYAFKNWSPDDSKPITRDTTFIPEYTQTAIPPAPNKYMVVWKNADGDGGQIWKAEQLEDGKVPTKPAKDPYRISEPGYRYEFTGWNPSTPTAVHGNTEYIAQYSRLADSNKYVWNGQSYSLTTMTSADSVSELYTDNTHAPERVTTFGDGKNIVFADSFVNKYLIIPPFIEIIAYNSIKLKVYEIDTIFIPSSVKTIERYAIGYEWPSFGRKDYYFRCEVSSKPSGWESSGSIQWKNIAVGAGGVSIVFQVLWSQAS